MREPSRIPVVINRLEKLWKQCPDMRLGQLIYNVCSGTSISQIEDYEMTERIDRFFTVAAVPPKGLLDNKIEYIIDGIHLDHTRLQSRFVDTEDALDDETIDLWMYLDIPECPLQLDIFDNPVAWESNYVLMLTEKSSNILNDDTVCSSEGYIAAKKWIFATQEKKSAFAEFARDMWIENPKR